MSAPYVHPLTHHAVLAVHGPDAAKFLQGQLTCNINYLSPSQAGLGARCTVKGRMLASFYIAAQSEGFLLILPSEQLESLRADLAKYAVFSKVTISDASAAWQLFGLSADAALINAWQLGEQAGQCVAHEHGLMIRLHDGRALLCLNSSADSSALLSGLASADENTWQLANIQAGLAEVTAATRELFIPQMLALQSLGGVSFKKGCYTGQEIVARMQYLGRLKRHLQRLQAAADTSLQPGMELFSPVHSSSVGEVVSVARHGGQQELLAVVQDDAVSAGQLFAGSLDGAPLSVLTLAIHSDHDRDISR